MKPTLRLALLGLALGMTWSASASAQEPLISKQVAAPAADVLSGLLRLPEASAHPTTSRAAWIEVELAQDASGVWSFETSLPVPVNGPLALALVSPDAARWRLRVRASDGELRPLGELFAPGRLERHTQVLGEDLPGWVIDRFDIAQAAAGLWTLHVDVPGASASEIPSRGFLIARDALPVQLSAHPSTQLLLSDAEIGLVAQLSDVRAFAPALRGAVRSARASVQTASGSHELALLDDGLHQDGAAGDGVFGALLPRWTSGAVSALIEVRGLDPQGGEFLRAAQLSFPVLERRVLLGGEAAVHVEDELRLRIELAALPLGPSGKLHVSSEVWGTGERGEPVAVCWLSRMLQPEERAGEWVLPVFLDGRWLDVARAGLPLELRNVRVQDPGTHVPFDLLERIPLEAAALPAVVGQGTTQVTPEMLMGPSPAAALSADNAGPHGVTTHVPIPRALMLVHGYCSGGSVWPPADFTQPKLQFHDPNANRTHDEFAQLLAAAGSNLFSFGVVGHSQGGPAALHLYTYYQSPLDMAAGPRRIQSVASPYQGTPLANLGGFACGLNNDMTPSGSAAWLAGIPSWARAEVFYWTTSNSGSACNFFTGLILDDPEDGTVEMVKGQLTGANNMGHVIGWCHTTGMSDPANYTDHVRNAQMNATAAR
jgi:hypothetical protein